MKSVQTKSKWPTQAVGYLFASVAALAVDMAVTLSLGLWLPPAAAAAIGFVFGSFVSYGLAKQWAFHCANSLSEFAGYFAVGFVTLAQTTATVYALTAYANWSLLFAKCAAIPVSFCVGFVLRKRLVASVAMRYAT